MHDRQYRADGCGLAGEQKAQGVRKAQHPLPHRARAKHVLHQMPRTLGHAPRAATGAKPALLAGKRHQPFRMALLAHHTQEAVVEHPAAQERLEFLAHVRGQRAVFCLKAREQVRVVRLHQRVQQRALGRVAGIGRWRRVRGRRRRARGIPQGRCEAWHGTLRCRDGRDGCTVFRAASSPPIGDSPAYG